MYLIREVFHCKPGKVRPLVEKLKADLCTRVGGEDDRGTSVPH